MSEAPAALLMTPGPTRVPERVLLAAHRVVHHRTPEFSAVLRETLDLLRPLFGSESADVLPVHATGRAAMEGAIVNFFAPGDEVVVCCNGRFGEMWAGFAESYGLHVRRVAEDWDRSVDPAEVGDALSKCREAKAVLAVHSDTSTGVLNPVGDIAVVARARGALSLVDGISSVGGTPFLFDDWGLDFAVTSSQKCLMSSPGIAFAVVSERAWRASERAAYPLNYLSFGAIRSTLDSKAPETPGTTPTFSVFQVREALRLIHEEGLARVFERHAAMADRTRERAVDLGFSLWGGDAIAARSPTLTALNVPDGIDATNVRASVRARGIQIAVGLGSDASRSVRIGHMGDIRMEDVDRTLDALADALA